MGIDLNFQSCKFAGFQLVYIYISSLETRTSVTHIFFTFAGERFEVLAIFHHVTVKSIIEGQI